MLEDTLSHGTQEFLVQLHCMDLTRENGIYPGRSGLTRSVVLASAFVDCLIELDGP